MNKQKSFQMYCEEQKALLKEYEEKEFEMDGIIARLPDKIADKYQEVFGKMMLFRSVHTYWSSYIDHVETWESSETLYYDVDDILKWLEGEKNGEGIQQCFPEKNVKPPHLDLSSHTVTLFYKEWYPNKKWSDEEQPTYRNSSRFEELFGAIYFLEHVSTLYEDTYKDLVYGKLLHMSSEQFKCPVELPSSKLVNQILFHLNGQVDVSFTNEVDAFRFYQFVSTYEKAEILPQLLSIIEKLELSGHLNKFKNPLDSK